MSHTVSMKFFCELCICKYALAVPAGSHKRTHGILVIHFVRLVIAVLYVFDYWTSSIVTFPLVLLLKHFSCVLASCKRKRHFHVVVVWDMNTKSIVGLSWSNKDRLVQRILLLLLHAFLKSIDEVFLAKASQHVSLEMPFQRCHRINKIRQKVAHLLECEFGQYRSRLRVLLRYEDVEVSFRLNNCVS